NAQLEVSTSGLPARLIAGLKRLATFANPKFYELQRLRFPTYKTPRFIFCGEIHPDRLVLPRGVLDEAIKLVEKAGAKVVVNDLRPSAEPAAFEFQGVLTRAQREAVKVCAAHEEGVLMAPAGAGKTVMGCALIAQRQTRTLVLTHRRPLLEQWKSQLIRFLGLKKRGVRVLSGKGGFRPGSLDLGMFQTLVRMENAAEVLSQYGHVVIDECHHVPAVSFEAVLKACSARYILGLTATPTRKDGLQKILFMQCGPVRHEMKDRGDARIERKVLVRRVSFKLVHDSERPPIHLVWEAMVNDGERTDQIVNDVAGAVAKGRRSLVLSDRKQHLLSLQEKLASKLSGADVAIFKLESGTGQKERKRVLEEARQRFSEGMGCVLLATSSLIGEGFDLPQLDTLFLAMPLSFKGRLIQYAGRLHRSFEGKRDVLIYDYIEPANALTMSMHRKRLIAYRQMGYRVETQSSASEQWLFHPGAAAP
ncbi:MAG: DEAD/DEAH box helicase family protein, partial [Verrucomicrobiia bacterium]